MTAKDIIENEEITKDLIVLFKTRNSQLPRVGPLIKDFVYIEPEAAKELVKKQVKMVGIDYISVDSVDAEGLPTHKILL